MTLYTPDLLQLICYNRFNWNFVWTDGETDDKWPSAKTNGNREEGAENPSSGDG